MAEIRKTRTVYIISSMLFNKSYIGSTSQKLYNRLAVHVCKFKNGVNKCKASEVLQHGDYMIAPLLIVPNCTRSEIELNEKEYLKQYKDIVVNKNNVQQTKEEYLQRCREDNKKHAMKYPDYKKNMRVTCFCGIEFNNSGGNLRHLASKKHLARVNNLQ